MWSSIRSSHFKNLFKTSCSRRNFILGIETSCDDSGAAIISKDGQILGESVASQTSARFGGVIPSFAMGFHAESLPKIIKDVVKQSTGVKDVPLDKLKENGIEIIAVTNRPGLSGSLSTGTNFAKYLCMKNQLPMIPIHHMEAHALTARMSHKVDFPFMVLLISGGHCLLALAKSVNKFYTLGKSNDNSPGEVLDKISRRLRLHVINNSFRDVSGGKAIEIIGKDGDPKAFEFNVGMRRHRDCGFSFSGLYSSVLDTISAIEEEVRPDHDSYVPDTNHICAGVEYRLAKHLCERVQRGFQYAELKDLWNRRMNHDHSRSLVVSGGVASNKRIKNSLEQVCKAFDVSLVAPEPKYCTDNGVMIAWNGLEHYRHKPEDVIVPCKDVLQVPIHPRIDFGVDISKDVISADIKCDFIKIL